MLLKQIQIDIHHHCGNGVRLMQNGKDTGETYLKNQPQQPKTFFGWVIYGVKNA